MYPVFLSCKQKNNKNLKIFVLCYFYKAKIFLYLYFLVCVYQALNHIFLQKEELNYDIQKQNIYYLFLHTHNNQPRGYYTIY